MKNRLNRLSLALRSGVTALWAARLSPSRAVRVGWWAALITLLALLVAGRYRGPLFDGVWFTLNFGLACVGAFWGLTHPRSVLKAKGLIFGLALLMALLAAFLLLSLQDRFSVEMPMLVFSDSAILLAALFVFPLAYPFCWFFGAMGASLGGFFSQHYEPDVSRGARYGVIGWWLAMWAGGTLSAQTTNRSLALWVWCGAPLFACLAARLTPHLRVNNVGVLRRAVRFLDRHLKVKLFGRSRRLDLGGVFLGVVAATALLLSGLMGIFRPVQMRLLTALVSFRSAPLVAQVSGAGFGDLDAGGQKWMHSIVVLHMDGITRRHILETDSEAAVQAKVIRLLSACHAHFIVLPSPVLNPDWQTNLRSTWETPPADEEMVRRARRDLPQLTAAMREADNVIFSLTDIHRVYDVKQASVHRPEYDATTLAGLRTLGNAAWRVGESSLDNLSNGRLPTIPIRWEATRLASDGPHKLPSLPIVLYAAIHRLTLPERIAETSSSHFQLDGKTLPLTEQGKILITYFAGEADAAFQTLSYQTLLEGDAEMQLPKPRNMMQALSSGETTRGRQKGKGKQAADWVSLQELLRDKIVFLDSFDTRLRQTPIGSLSEPELMAHAATTLLTGSIVHRKLTQPVLQVALAALLLAGLIGHLSLRRTPLQAGVIAGFIGFTFVIVCLLSFLFAQVWIDPLIPLMSGLAAYLLVVQYTYAVDRWEMSRNRELLELYLDRNTVNQYLEDGHILELGGVRKPICVLFADVRGFSRFASEHQPEEVVLTINKYLTAMAAEVFEYDGMLDKFLGDGMLALFGIPEAREDDALRAVQAAYAMQEAARRISEELIREGKEALSLGIGLHYGEAVVGLMGSERRPDLTAIGHTVVVGQRIQGTAAAGEIVMTADFYARLGRTVQVQSRPAMQVKGLAEPVLSYSLLSLNGTHSRTALPDGAVITVPPLPTVPPLDSVPDFL